jgi:hypothetical protein
MLIQVIKNTFQNLDLEELKSFRLICKLWNEVAQSFLQEKCLLKLPDSASLLSYNEFTLELKDKGLMDIITNFQNYSIKLVEGTEEEVPKLLVNFQTFWNANSLSIRELSLDLSPNLTRRVIKTILSSIIAIDSSEGVNFQLSALKVRVLKFFDNHSDQREAQESEPLGIHQRFRTSINSSLKSFEYTNYAFDNSPLCLPLSWEFFFRQFVDLKVNK